MKHYDVLVIGSGSGAHVVDRATEAGLRVGLIDEGPVGGTCMNLACVPSKMLIFVADRVTEIQESGKLGITAEVRGIDFDAVMSRMRRVVASKQAAVLATMRSSENVTFYDQRARFTGERTMQVGDEEVRGKRVFVASGSRAVVPPIDGLDEVDYLDNESVLSLASPPRSVVIVGGGYVGTEYAHFLAAVGSEVTLLQRGARLLPREEEDVSLVLERRLRERMDVRTDVTVTGVRREGGGYVVSGEKQEKGASRSGEQGDPPGTGAERLEFRGERVFIAAGRRSNADLLDVEKAGIKLTERGYIAVNDRLETSADKVWSFGDAIGKAMFTHAAGQEAAIAWHNSVHPDDAVEMDFDIVPHAVFTHPQIAAVGLTEKEAMERGIDYLIGRASYTDVTKGEAMREDDGFAKAIVDPVSHRILGFHIIGPYAPILIQEPANAMALGLDARQVVSAMHIHPALPELVQEALNRVGRR